MAQPNPMVRPIRPMTNMYLVGVGVYAVDLAAMLAAVLQHHGYVESEPKNLTGLLTAGDKAITQIVVSAMQ